MGCCTSTQSKQKKESDLDKAKKQADIVADLHDPVKFYGDEEIKSGKENGMKSEEAQS